MADLPDMDQMFFNVSDRETHSVSGDGDVTDFAFIKYDKKNKIFLLALERFTWETANGKDYNLKQVLAILTIKGVEKIHDKSIFFNNLIYNVLSINSYDNTILILLSDNKIISLEAHKWTCLLEDIGKPNWPAVTPTHLLNEK